MHLHQCPQPSLCSHKIFRSQSAFKQCPAAAYFAKFSSFLVNTRHREAGVIPSSSDEDDDDADEEEEEDD